MAIKPCNRLAACSEAPLRKADEALLNSETSAPSSNFDLKAAFSFFCTKTDILFAIVSKFTGQPFSSNSANFLSAKIIQPSFAEIDHDLRFLTAHYPSAYRIDRTRGANPISQPLENLNFAGSLYGPIIYQKAPIVMRHLETRIGAEQLRKGLVQYLERYSFGNASWTDLIEILAENSGQNLKSWNHDWVQQAGLPIISVRRTDRGVELVQKDPMEMDRTWEQSLTVIYGNMREGKISSFSETINMVNRIHKIDDLGGIDFVIPNGSGVEYGQFLLDTESQEFLLKNVDLVQDDLLRGSVWISLWEQVLQNRLNPERFFSSLLRAIGVEKDELLLATLLDYLQECFVKYLDVAYLLLQIILLNYFLSIFYLF